ncbi:hypothetical protein BH10PSE7_BH10PSE7_19780 [soil metagenome]
MFTDLSGFLQFAMVVIMVVVLAGGMTYGTSRWRKAPHDPQTERAKREAIQSEYKGPDKAV